MIQIILDKSFPVEMARLNDLILSNYIICRNTSSKGTGGSVQVLLCGVSKAYDGFYFANYTEAMFAMNTYSASDLYVTRKSAIIASINAGDTVFAFDSISEFTKYALERL